MMKRIAIVIGMMLQAAAAQASDKYFNCAIVLPTRDGYVALRQHPDSKSLEVTRLQPFDSLSLEQNNFCSQEGECDEEQQWTAIHYVPRIDGSEPESETTRGWVATKLIRKIYCP